MGSTDIIRVVSNEEGDAPPKRFPIAASKVLSSSSGSATGVGWLRLLFETAPAFEKKSSI